MIMYAEIFIIRIFVDSRLIFQVISGFVQHEKDAHRNLAPIDGRTSSQSLFWTLFVKKRISYEYVKTAGRKGKRERPLGEKGKGKGERSGFVRIPTLQPERAHARTNRNRNRFPGWSHSPQPPISYIIYCISYISKTPQH